MLYWTISGKRYQIRLFVTNLLLPPAPHAEKKKESLVKRKHCKLVLYSNPQTFKSKTIQIPGWWLQHTFFLHFVTIYLCSGKDNLTLKPSYEMIPINFISNRKLYLLAPYSGGNSTKFSPEVGHNFSKSEFHSPRIKHERLCLVSLT